MTEILSKNEVRRLGELEVVIEKGMEAFLEVGTALTEIRDGRLYKAEFRTFEEYCRQRWDMTRQYANQLISAVHVVNSLETTVSKPDSERHARPLAQLPTKERSSAWEEAVKSAPNGKPTAAKVQEVVNSRLATINGQYAADPPEIAKARANGKIPHDAVVTIEEPDESTSLEEIAEDHEESRAQSEDEMGDDDWLNTLSLTGKLDGYLLRDFKIDALVYRHLDKARAIYLYHATREIKRQHRGEYGQRVKFFLELDPPDKWMICTDPKNGGCGGSGRFGPNKLECPQCKGRGYWIPR